MRTGAFAFVLHSHLPYCRRAGVWPHGEDWLHEACAETYLPLLNALYDLLESGVLAPVTLGLTPVLTEQLADPLVRDHLCIYLETRIASATDDIQRFEREGQPREVETLCRTHPHVLAQLIVHQLRIATDLESRTPPPPDLQAHLAITGGGPSVRISDLRILRQAVLARW